MTTLYPIFADLTGRPVLVVGGGRVAVRKVRTLLRSGALVTVVSPDVTDGVRELADSGDVELHERGFELSDLDGRWLVVAATDDADVNRAVFDEANGRRMLCNVVDQPDLCSFHVPAVVRRGLLQIAISTGGASPAMARRIRERLEDEFGPKYEGLLAALQDLRNHLKARHPGDQTRRQELLESFIDEVAGDADASADPEVLKQRLDRWKSL